MEIFENGVRQEIPRKTNILFAKTIHREQRDKAESPRNVAEDATSNTNKLIIFVAGKPTLNLIEKMKIKHYIGAAATLALMGACAETEKGYVISGEAVGTETGTVYLKKYLDREYVDVDSATIRQGRFELRGTFDEPMLYGLTIYKESKRPLPLFLGNESVSVRLDEAAGELEATGSDLHEQYARNAPHVREEGYNIDSLVATHPASAVCALFLLRDFAWRLNLQQLSTLRGKLDRSLDGSYYVSQVDSIIARLQHLQPGASAPDFTLPDAEGNPVRLADFRGRYVLVDFWASWCPDCRRENPNIVAAYDRFKEKGFTVLGVSLDRNREAWLKAIEKDGLAWTHISDLQAWNSPIAGLYAIRWIPTGFLLDPEGKILAVGLEGEALMEKLAELVD